MSASSSIETPRETLDRLDQALADLTFDLDRIVDSAYGIWNLVRLEKQKMRQLVIKETQMTSVSDMSVPSQKEKA